MTASGARRALLGGLVFVAFLVVPAGPAWSYASLQEAAPAAETTTTETTPLATIEVRPVEPDDEGANTVVLLFAALVVATLLVAAATVLVTRRRRS